MFKSLKRIVYYVTNIEEAKKWYTAILNVRPLFDAPSVAIFQVGNCSLSIVTGNPPTPAIKGLSETYWEVDDVEYAFNRLIELGAIVHTPVREAFNIKTAKVLDPFGNIIGITGNATDPKKQSVENQPSQTAMTVAFCRALAFVDEREEIRGADSLAVLFLKDEAKQLLANSEKRKWTIQNLVTSNLYGYLISRTKYFDDIFNKYLSEGIEQIVFLGAGYDTRSFRYKASIKNTKIFELDINSTQNRKLEILNNERIEIPEQLSFVRINFKTDSLEDILKDAGFSTKKRTLFIWEGVVYYLSQETVIETLKNIIKISTEGSVICFDYLKEKLDSVNSAEPFMSWINEKEIDLLLKDLGIKVIRQVDSTMMEINYLTLNNGETGEKTLSQFNFLEGEISSFCRKKRFNYQ